MKKRIDLSLPQFAFIVATRAALAAGVGLLATGRMGPASRRRLGKSLLAFGLTTTIPAALILRGVLLKPSPGSF